MKGNQLLLHAHFTIIFGDYFKWCMFTIKLCVNVVGQNEIPLSLNPNYSSIMNN